MSNHRLIRLGNPERTLLIFDAAIEERPGRTRSCRRAPVPRLLSHSRVIVDFADGSKTTLQRVVKRLNNKAKVTMRKSYGFRIREEQLRILKPGALGDPGDPILRMAAADAVADHYHQVAEGNLRGRRSRIEPMKKIARSLRTPGTHP
jgi:hypothetical protein